MLLYLMNVGCSSISNLETTKIFGDSVQFFRNKFGDFNKKTYICIRISV